MKKRIHLTGYSHIDPAYLWQWDEGYRETIHTCAYVISLLKEVPSLTFTRGNANSYKLIEELSPDVFKEIKKLAMRP